MVSQISLEPGNRRASTRDPCRRSARTYLLDLVRTRLLHEVDELHDFRAIEAQRCRPWSSIATLLSGLLAASFRLYLVLCPRLRRSYDSPVSRSTSSSRTRSAKIGDLFIAAQPVARMPYSSIARPAAPGCFSVRPAARLASCLGRSTTAAATNHQEHTTHSTNDAIKCVPERNHVA